MDQLIDPNHAVLIGGSSSDEYIGPVENGADMTPKSQAPSAPPGSP